VEVGFVKHTYFQRTQVRQARVFHWRSSAVSQVTNEKQMVVANGHRQGGGRIGPAVGGGQLQDIDRTAAVGIDSETRGQSAGYMGLDHVPLVVAVSRVVALAKAAVAAA
jgi:hypothetical protein